MATPVLLPQLGLTMNEGLIIEWKKKEGDPVAKGDLLFLVENDKSTIEVEAQTDGILLRVLVKEMETVPVGTEVGIIAAPGEKTDSGPPAAGPAALRPPPAPEKPAMPPDSSAGGGAQTSSVPHRGSAPDGFVPASPIARRIASERGLILSAIPGSGPGGAVLEKDVSPGNEKIAEKTAVAGDSISEEISLSRLRTIAAERMTLSWTTVPQFTLYGEARAGNLLELLRRSKDKGSPLSLTAVLAKLLARALRNHPLLNGSWAEGGRVRLFRTVDVGIAMDTPEGLLVPVLRNCGDRGFLKLTEDLKALHEKGRTNSLGMEDMKGGTITLSNLGMFGVKRFRALINPPQSAIIAVGAINRKPVEKEGQPVFESFIEYGITADHRVVDGAYAARFLADFTALIEDPVLSAE